MKSEGLDQQGGCGREILEVKPIILILMDHLRLTEPTLPNEALMSDLSQGKDDASFRVSVLLSSGSALLFHLLYSRLNSKECIQQLITNFLFCFNLFGQNTECRPAREFYVCRLLGKNTFTS